jgi:regulatory protein YycH of two-component signal transduction system YycFG
MNVVFRFESFDDRQRATLVVSSIDDAISHMRETFQLEDFAMDEDGTEPIDLDEIREILASRRSVNLHDLEGWHSKDTVEIACATDAA